MKCTRRELGLLLPTVFAASAMTSRELAAQQAAPAGGANSVEALPVMKTQRFGFDEIPVTTNGKNKQRRMFTAKTIPASRSSRIRATSRRAK